VDNHTVGEVEDFAMKLQLHHPDCDILPACVVRRLWQGNAVEIFATKRDKPTHPLLVGSVVVGYQSWYEQPMIGHIGLSFVCAYYRVSHIPIHYSYTTFSAGSSTHHGIECAHSGYRFWLCFLLYSL
jgi:hypothetical protein